MALFKFSFSLVVFTLLGAADCHRLPRRTGDQAPKGECQGFKWGGTSGIHFYGCCNNCNDSDTSCDRITYQTASSTTYCNSCGVDNKKGNGVKTHSFYCGGCPGQTLEKITCSSGLRKFYEIPGFCWAFMKCFENKCKRRYRNSATQALQTDTFPDSCFDLKCESGEDVSNCPTDCCGTVNPNCAWEKYNNTKNCPDPCCGELGCCLTDAGTLPMGTILCGMFATWAVVFLR